MKIIAIIAFMALATSVSMVDGAYGDTAFKVMIASAAVLLVTGLIVQKRAASDGTLNGSKDFNTRRL